MSRALESAGPEGTRTLGTGQLPSRPKCGSDDSCSGASCSSGGPRSSRDYTPDRAQASDFDYLLLEILEFQRKQGQLEEGFENLKAHYRQDYTVAVEALEEERCRCELLEEQLNDLSELHQSEVLNLKEEFASVDTKIAHRAYEGAADIREALEACQTRISKMELQQLVQPEDLDNAAAHTLFGKLTSVLLAIMSVLLALVSTGTYGGTPLMKTSRHLLFTPFLLFLLLILLWRHWDAVSDYCHLFCIHNLEKGGN